MASTIPRGNVLGAIIYRQSLTPVSVAANTSAEQTFTVKGVIPGDFVSVLREAALTAGLGIVNARVSAADTVAITFSNGTASPIVPAAGNFLFYIARPENSTPQSNVVF